MIEQDAKLEMADFQSIIAEMRLLLLETKLLTEAGELQGSQELARQSLALFDSLLYAHRLQSRQTKAEYSSHSLIAVTEDVLEHMTPLAKMYQIRLEFETKTPKKIGVSVVKPAFEHATRSLLHGLIMSLQNQPKACLRIRAGCLKLPTLRFFSDKIPVAHQNNSVKLARSKINPDVSGLSSGLLLARWIYRQTGSQFKWTSNQYGRGIGVAFRPTRQMSLMET